MDAFCYIDRLIRDRAAQALMVVIRYGFACFLIIAAALKAELLLSTYPGQRSTANWTVLLKMPVIVIECGIAGWLISGIEVALARRASIALLLVFVFVNAWQLMRHVNGCGCFGRVELHPGWTLALDMGLLLCIWTYGHRYWKSSRLSGETLAISRRGLRLFASLFVTVTVFSLTISMARRFRTGPAGTPPLIVLDPEKLRGHAFPLFGEIVPPIPELARGQWSVLIIDHNCSICMHFLGEYHPRRRERSIVIDAADGDPVRLPNKAFRLKHGANFVLIGPTAVELEDGVVRFASVGGYESGMNGGSK